MPYVQEYRPQIRDADLDGHVGLRGGMRCFQDVHTGYMHSIGKGNDVLPRQYGAVWVYTRCLIRMEKKLEYGEPATLTAWVEPVTSAARAVIDVTIAQNGAIAGCGRIESCVCSLKERRPLRLSAIAFPEEVSEQIGNDIPPFFRPDRSIDGLEKRYEKTVRFCDLDSSRHMNNLRYVEMFQDAYDSAFWADFEAREMEISFLSQCLEGETLTVLGRAEGDGVRLAALHADGSVASVAVFTR